jgi:hypothetical protein
VARAAGNVGLAVKGATSQTADLTQWLNSSGTVLASINKDGVVYSAASGVSLYQARFGDFAIQSLDADNGFIGNNSYWNGSSWARIATGYAAAFQFYRGQILFHGANTGSGTYSPQFCLKTDYNNSVAIGGNISPNTTTYTGAHMLVDGSTGDVGVGVVSSLSARLHIIKTTEQLRVGYDASNYYSTTVGSTGLVTFNAVGSGSAFAFSDDLKLDTVGKGLYVKEGSNATMGTATLVAGTVTVSTTKVTANSRIFLTVNGGTLTNIGSTYISARTAGTSFTISSTNILDASDVAWIIVEPA